MKGFMLIVAMLATVPGAADAQRYLMRQRVAPVTAAAPAKPADTVCPTPASGKWISGGDFVAQTTGMDSPSKAQTWCSANKSKDFKGLCMWNSQFGTAYLYSGATAVPGPGYLYASTCS